jgi:hypothetical protein
VLLYSSTSSSGRLCSKNGSRRSKFRISTAKKLCLDFVSPFDAIGNAANPCSHRHKTFLHALKTSNTSKEVRFRLHIMHIQFLDYLGHLHLVCYTFCTYCTQHSYINYALPSLPTRRTSSSQSGSFSFFAAKPSIHFSNTAGRHPNVF